MTLKRSFLPIVDARTRLLVCGSLPGDRSLAEGRYYAHPQNQFWRLMSPAIGRDMATLDYDARLACMRSAGVGLWDAVAEARREGSGDTAIREIAGNDIAALVAGLPELRAIAFNGGTALKLGQRQLGEAAARYEIVSLPSSSPLHTVGLAAKAPAWERLRDYLDDPENRS